MFGSCSFVVARFVRAAVLLLCTLSSITTPSIGFNFHSPLPEPTLLIVNHLSDLRYSFPVPDLLVDSGFLASAFSPPVLANRTYRNYLLSADPLLSSIGVEQPDDNEVLDELRQSGTLPNDTHSPLIRMQRTQEWSGLSGQVVQSDSCSYPNHSTPVESSCFPPNNLALNVPTDAGLMAASPDSGLHSESNVTSEASYSSNDPSDYNNRNHLLPYGTQDEAFSSDLQSQVDFSGALAQAFQFDQQPPDSNQNVNVLCNSFDAMSTACQNQLSTEVPVTQLSQQSQVNSTDFILSDLLSESDFQMLSFPTPTLNTEQPSESASLTKNNDTNDVQSDSAISSLSPSDLYDSESDNLSNFEDHVGDFVAIDSQKPQSAQYAQSDKVGQSSTAAALPVAPVNNNTYFECLDANNCTLNYDFYLRSYDLNDSVTTINGNSFATSAACNAAHEPCNVPIQCNPLENVMHNHSYTVLTPVESAEALPLRTETHAPINFNHASSNHVDDFSFEHYASMNSSRKGASGSSMDSYSVTSESPSEEDRCMSRDERKARELQIPITVADIINLPIDEFNERLSRYDLSEPQLTLIRDIRRRGKNKVAAQNCRKRKMDQILGLQQEVDQLYMQKNSLLAYSDRLFSLRDLAHAKYQNLYDFVRQSASGSTLTALQYNFGSFPTGSSSTSSNGNRASMFNETIFADPSGSGTGFMVNSTSSSKSSASTLSQTSFKKAILAIN